MALCVALTNEAGENLELVADAQNFLRELLPGPEDDLNPMLGSIDWYGDTVFNSIQMRRFLREWGKLEERATLPDEKGFICTVRKMALRCEAEVHMYLKFIGD